MNEQLNIFDYLITMFTTINGILQMLAERLPHIRKTDMAVHF